MSLGQRTDRQAEQTPQTGHEVGSYKRYTNLYEALWFSSFDRSQDNSLKASPLAVSSGLVSAPEKEDSGYYFKNNVCHKYRTSAKGLRFKIHL